MSCRFCGTALPGRALFCGECGRPVTAEQAHALESVPPVASVSPIASVAPVASVDERDIEDEELPAVASTGFSIADLLSRSPEAAVPAAEVPVAAEVPAAALPAAAEVPAAADLPAEVDVPAEVEAPAARCPQCGAPMAEGDVFCGECGFVLRTVEPPSGERWEDVVPPSGERQAGVEQPSGERQEDAVPRTGAGDAPTSIIVLPDLIRLGAFPADPEAPSIAEQAEHPLSGEAPERDVTSEVEPVPFSALDAIVAVAPVSAEQVDGVPVDEVPVEEVPVDELVHETPSHSAPVVTATDPDLDFDEPLPFALPISTPVPTSRSRPIPDPFPWGTDQTLQEDLEATRLVADPAAGIRFVLQFSTGESVTVIGSGLVGRNPSVQPGEYVDQLVPIFDAGKSVSKTHLEFGQEGGRFWVSDRYSTNGSVIRQPDIEPRRADPGRRYFVARGTRVDVGEQFFVVS